MEHRNPLLDENADVRFLAVGEIMLRLTPPNYEKIRIANNFEANYGGCEANIALALANLGVDSTFFSVVPNNSLGKSAIRMLRSNILRLSKNLVNRRRKAMQTWYLWGLSLRIPVKNTDT